MTITITVDWSLIKSKDDFYNTVLPQMQAPAWHGRNGDALRDSWVTGDISPVGPPFDFRFINFASIKSELKELAEMVFEIAGESVDKNGGAIVNDHTPR